MPSSEDKDNGKIFACNVYFNTVLAAVATDDASLYAQNKTTTKNGSRKSRAQKEKESYIFELELRKQSCLPVKIHKQLQGEGLLGGISTLSL